ncbi:hypothetical protein [Desulfosporosinus meridiei]|uniref:Uncharacterized protein n=1 Tax=Desulfosporosinus meridiei (strain ATCC BAA-275 / DSM 13257 / KCTC 12902 / NCIMB 13706 / S10) TaxID=768704 RepID=J7J5N2_DESMD|nr:hypothetical protein [Desulfosporosinus meridiei]AFQ46251.1 hypothetical protein Desmer_4445 [Desulfosporosinus meridiei DSM 13257]
MSVQTITLLIAGLSLMCFFGTMYGIQTLVKQGRDTGKQLQVAGAVVDTVESVHAVLEPIIPDPVDNVIDTILKVTQTGVHSAQQLYNSGQLPPELRKDQATEYAMNMIKLTGREITPDLKQVIRSTAEAAVFVMKQQGQKPDPVLSISETPSQVLNLELKPVQQSV